MKWFTFPALLAAALFSAVVVIPFLPAAKNHSDVFSFEVHATSSAEARVKVYYDIGRGYVEADSSEDNLAKSDAPQLYRLALPRGEYRSIRFDPIDGAGTVTLTEPPRLVSQTGRVIRRIEFSELEPLQQIESARAMDGRFEIRPVSAANDPQLRVMFSPPIVLAPTWRERVAGFFPRAIGVFIGLAPLLFAIDRSPRLRRRVAGATAWLATRPHRAIGFIGAVAVVGSAYPVVFLGKSFVAPNFGTTLLYESYPTLPGTTDERTAGGNGSDVGAAMWADVPYAFMQRRALASGELPLWNRYTVGGIPLLGQGQSMFGDPLQLIVIAGNSAAWAWDLKFLLAKWLFAMGVGFSVFAMLQNRNTTTRTRGMEFSSALAVAMIVTAAAPFIGFYIYRINHPAIFGLAYAPWVLRCWLGVADSRERGPLTKWLLGLFAANLGLMTSGTVKEAAILLLAMNATGACIVITQPSPWRMRLAKLGGAIWAGVLLIGATVPLWATFYRALNDAFTGSANPAAAQIQPSLLLGAFDELFFRPLSAGEVVFNPSLNLLLLLGLLYFLATIRVQLVRRDVQVIVAATVVCMAFVFGVVPIAVIIQLPFLAHIGHIENCFLCALFVLWSVLAGMGFSAAAVRLRTPAGRGDLLIAAGWLFALVSAWLAFRQVSHRELFGAGSTFNVHPQGTAIAVNPFIWAYLGATIAASIGLGLLGRVTLSRGRMAAGHVILIVVCVLVLLWRNGLHDFRLGFETYLVQPPARANFHARSTAIELIRERHRAEPTRVFGLHGNLTPGWNTAYGLEAIYGADALQNRWVRELIDVSPVRWSSIWRVYVPVADTGLVRPFLDALNVRFYVDLPNNPNATDAGVKRIHSSDLAVYESATAWPRAFFTDRVDRYESPAELMTKIIAANGTPFAALQATDLRARPDVAALSSDMTSRHVVAAKNYRLTENTTSFDLHATSAGLIVLQEGWWPGAFQVDVNGRPAPIVRVNHAFKGIFVPAAGDFRVTFSYWPKHFTRHLVLASIAAVLAAFSLYLGLQPPRRQRQYAGTLEAPLSREPVLPTA